MSKVMPYLPDPRPEGPSFEHMQAVLAKHAKPTPDGAAKPDAQPSALRRAAPVLAWMDPVKHGDGTGYQLSVDGLYSVTKVKVLGEFTYDVWLRVPAPKILGRAKSAAEGRTKAQAHLEAT